MVRKLGSKLLITRQKCVKVRPVQTDAAAKLKKGSSGSERVSESMEISILFSNPSFNLLMALRGVY